jgi:PAS domain S-box-containing protein
LTESRRPRFIKFGYLIFALLLLAFLPACASQTNRRIVRVGVYQNEPKVFLDRNGKATGFFLDLLKEIAKRENWTLEYTPCKWEECLQALTAGEIDIMPDVAYSTERDLKFDFHKIPAAESWSRIYAAPNVQIIREDQLNGKKIIVLSNSIQQTALEKMRQDDGYQFTILSAKSQDEALSAVKNGEADAVLTNYFYGDYFYKSYGLVKTQIILDATTLYYATAQGKNPDLLDTIDRYLSAWRDDSNSPYASILNHWLNPSGSHEWIRIVIWVVGAGLILLGAAFFWISSLRKEVRERTKNLTEANQILHDQEERYRLISTVASDYMFSTIVDNEGHLTLNWVAGAFEAITGYSFDEYVAQGGWRALLHPDDLSIDDEDLRQLRHNHSVVSEIRTIHKDRRIVWVRVYAHPVWDGTKNQLVGIYGAVQDITERKQAEEIIEASERRLSLILNTVTDVIFLLAVEPENTFRFISINPAFLMVTGLQREQVIDKTIAEVIPEPAREMVLKNYLEAIRENKTVTWEEVSNYPLGQRIGEVAVTPFYDKSGTCTFLVGSVHDITENKQAENKIRKINEELELRVQERTAELESAKIRAESADRLKSAFLATMSHELRTPLNSIIGFTGMLLMKLVGPLEPEQEKQLNMVQDSARHLLELINDVLDISKIEAGQFEIARESFDMASTVKKSVEKTLPLAEKKGLKLRAEISDDVGVISGDRRRVEQVIINLLSNAIKFTDQGEIMITCYVDGRQIITSVADTGIGIQPDQIDDLFQPFKQLDTGITRKHEGTGLGLSICKKLVELMGGEIGVDSQWGQGSRFYFTLPLKG